MHKNAEDHRAWVLSYRPRALELQRVRRAAAMQPDDVVVTRLAIGDYRGRVLRAEKRLAADLCFVRGYSNLETASRLRVSLRTAERHRARWRTSLDQVGH